MTALPPSKQHWDLDWSQATPATLPVSSLVRRQYSDHERPQGRFDLQKMPPIKVLYQDGAHWIMDGHHRVDWAARQGIAELPSLVLREAAVHTADAEQAKSTGGMVALIPRRQDAEMLAVPGGEPVDDLHLTVVYLGEDVTDQDPTELTDHLTQIVGDYPPFECKVFGIGQFNPQGDEPCIVYLIGDNPDLSPLYRDLKEFVAQRYPGSAEQHDPHIPHVTAGYSLPPEAVTYQGPVVFDQIAIHWAGKVKRFPL